MVARDGHRPGTVKRAASRAARERGLTVTSNVCVPACPVDARRYPGVRFGACNLDVRRRPITRDAWGDVRFCNHSPVVLGNLFERDLKAILDSPNAAAWRTVPAFCASCRSWAECLGGCRAASEQLGLGLGHGDPAVEADAVSAPAPAR